MSRSQNMLGLGIYFPQEGARLLQVRAVSLRRWARGYTYWIPGHRTRLSSRPIIKSDLPIIKGQRALSFLELMELRVVAKLRRKGISLQHIRAAAAIARQVLGTRHPFASRRVFTDRKHILTYLDAPPAEFEMIELHRSTVHQLIAGPLLEPLLEDLDFDQESGIANRWWPLGKNYPIVLDPEVSFGAPTVAGTRIRTEIVAGMAAVDTIAATSTAYEIPSDQVEAAVTFEQKLRAA